MPKIDANVMRRLCMTSVVLGTLAGCSSVPDAVNPVSWYRDARDWVAGDDSAAQAKADAAKPVPGADQPYPSLATVPDRPPQPSTAEDRRQAERSLAADREQARYTDEEIRRQTDDGANRPRRPATPPPQAAALSDTPQAAQRPSPPPPPQTAAPASPPAAPQPAAPPPSPAAAPGPTGPMPSVPSAPPPPPMVAPAPVDVPVPATARPQSAAVPPASAPVAPPPSSQTRPPAQGPLPAFGPPPADIAIVQESGAGVAPATRPMRSARPDPVTVFPDAGYPPSAGFAAGAPPSVQGMAPGAGVQSGPVNRLATIYFASGSARLNGRDAAAIRRAVQAYKAQGGTLTVVGHASSRTRNLDPMRREMANFAISLDRANAVAREIIRLGVDPSAVQVVAMSDAQPVYQEVMPSAEAGNRRVDILIEN